MKILFLLMLTSCASMYEEMYKDYIGRAMVRETMIREFQPVDSKSYFVEDKNLSINYSPTITDAGVSVQFKNKRDKVIKIIWDESVFMSPGGSSEGIFHAGVTIADRSAPKPATVIPPMTSHSDDLIVNSLVSFSASQYGSGWTYQPLCGDRDIYEHTLDDKNCVGQVFGFYITYEVEGKKQALTLKYKYVGSTPKPKEEKKKK